MIMLSSLQILKDNIEGFAEAVANLEPISFVGISDIVYTSGDPIAPEYTIFDEDGFCIGFIMMYRGNITHVVPYTVDIDEILDGNDDEEREDE